MRVHTARWHALKGRGERDQSSTPCRARRAGLAFVSKRGLSKRADVESFSDLSNYSRQGSPLFPLFPTPLFPSRSSASFASSVTLASGAPPLSARRTSLASGVPTYSSTRIARSVRNVADDGVRRAVKSISNRFCISSDGFSGSVLACWFWSLLFLFDSDFDFRISDLLRP
jgi:hypothetical protein